MILLNKSKQKMFNVSSVFKKGTTLLSVLKKRNLILKDQDTKNIDTSSSSSS